VQALRQLDFQGAELAVADKEPAVEAPSSSGKIGFDSRREMTISAKHHLDGIEVVGKK
jgi:hypothetical protein